MSSGGQVTIEPITRISLCQALLLHYLCERRPVLPREVRDELCVVPDHHLVARVAELLRDPPDLLAALKREGREGVPGLALVEAGHRSPLFAECGGKPWPRFQQP